MEKDTDKAILDGLQAWREREQNLAGYFSPAAMKSREALTLKLDHYRELNAANAGGKSLLRGVLQAEIKNIERQLRPNWLLRQSERLSYNIGQGFKAFAEWVRPKVVEEKASLFKAPEARKEVTVEGALKTQARERSKELPTLKVDQVLRVAAKQEDKRLLMKKSRKNDLLPKKTQQKSKSLSVR
jgi:hypothetical protein